MSEQLTDEQVAWYAGTSRTAKWTADMAVHENIITLAREVQEHRALRPTCPTCRGSQQIMDLRCDNCGGSASLPFGMTCSNHLARPTPCPDCTDGKIPLDKWVALQGDVAKSIDQLLNGHTITERLAEGWYPSGRDPDTGEVQHDRHVLIWLRNYEELLRKASAVLKMAGVT